MRLIDADRLSEIIRGNVSAPYEDSREAKEECLRIIEDALTIDAVPVARCKDCIWHNRETCCPLAYSGLVTENGVLPCENDFCSYGERK